MESNVFFLRDDTLSKLPEFVFTGIMGGCNLRIYINSTGGDILPAIEAVNLMRNYSRPIETIINGCAESAALLIAISGTSRKCFSNSWGMTHAFSTSIEGSYYELKDMQRHHDILHNTILDIYSDAMSLPKANIEALLFNRQVRWLNPSEMLQLNMIDEII